MKDQEKSRAQSREMYMKDPEKSRADTAAQSHKIYEKDLEKSRESPHPQPCIRPPIVNSLFPVTRPHGKISPAWTFIISTLITWYA